jgi:predicted nucleic acid-binding Zn ribbon protein
MSTQAAADFAALVNISAEKWPPRQRTYFGSLEIRPVEAGEAFAITTIRGCTGVMDLGDKRIMEYKITAREIAEDIAREINGDSGEGSFHGVFVAAGDLPTEAELADARQRLEEFQRRLVAAADLEWERTKNPMFITDLERRAARQLGLEKPWLYDAKPLADCPVCAEKIKPGVAVCRSCGAILDREKVALYGFVQRDRKSAMEPQRQGEKRDKEAGK